MSATSCKASKSDIIRLPFRKPEEVLALTFPDGRISSMCTLYAGMRSETGNPVVRLNLVAGCEGHRNLLASCFLFPGFTGPAIVATGVCVDGWHVEAQSTTPVAAQNIRLSVSLAARECCSGFGVFVPPTIAQPGGDSDIAMASPIRPFGQTEGYWRPLFGTDGTITLDRWDHVLRIAATAGVAMDGFVQGFPNSQNWIIPKNTTQELWPHGNLSGPMSLDFQNTIAFTIERVR